jgi:hypothetical protein
LEKTGVRNLLILLLAALNASLSPASSQSVRAAGPAESRETVSEQRHASFSCESFPGAGQVVALAVAGRRFIVMGEKHGTEQAPHLFGTLVCEVARRGPVSVFLEFRAGATNAVQAYIGSDGSEQARRTFLANDIWDPRYADGRNSRAMFALVEALRRLRQAGAPIRVFGTQPDYPTLRPQFYSELGRADDWARLAVAYPDGVNLILVGTAHAALRDNDDLGFLPAAAHLRPADVLAIGPVPEGGAQWALNMSDTGQPIAGISALPGRAGERGIVMLRSDASGWNATYAFGDPARPSLPQGQR